MRTLTLAEADLTHDAFLGGRLHLLQPARGFRAGIDAVLLAAAVPAQSGDRVLELGCGVGTASLCLAARVPDLRMTGVEVQAEYAALAQRNAADAAIPLTVVQADLRHLPAEIRNTQFTHVLMNPPYFDRDLGTSAQDAGRDTAMGGATPLADWLDIGIKRLAPKGHLTLIMRMDRLPEVLCHIGSRLGSIVVRPIAGRANKAPNLFLLRGIQAGRAPFRLSTPLIMHTGDAHTLDTESYTTEVRGILRNAANLDISH